jgi:ferredoxin-nitrite reductase
MGDGFSQEQKEYLDGFLAGALARRGTGKPAEPIAALSDIHRAAQDRFTAAGRSLTAEEQAKRDAPPLEMWDELCANAAAGRFPKGIDVFRHKFHGLFYVAPAQNAFMLRLRIPNGVLSAHQLHGVASLAETHAGGYADVTTRANLQLREIGAKHSTAVLMALAELGLTSKGAGADNIRNITSSPTAGIDRQELIDTRGFARDLHFHILHHRELYGLPRKFNIAFDGGGLVGALEDTNDIGFAAVAVPVGAAVPSGVYFRLLLAGITGHGDFARDAGIAVAPEDCVAVAHAIIRVFIAAGDRTDRTRARLKYLIDDWGIARFLEAVETELGRKLTRLALDACAPRGPRLKHGHVGVHAQRQSGFSYIGVLLPVGRLYGATMRGLAGIAERFGSGTIRLTPWQNLILSDIADADVAAAEAAIVALGLDTRPHPIRGALVACTGNTGCKFAATDTKGEALRLAAHLETRVALDQPVNIHLTGCPNSCAQHYIGDIGLLGTRRAEGDAMIEAYTVLVGGGTGGEQRLACEITRDRMLRAYLAQRRGSDESFQQFCARHPVEALRHLFASAEEIAA